jgi:F0F1-type ATP synthase epsilon subunit
MSSMKIHIAKVNGVLWSGEAESLTAPGAEGRLMVLQGHMPFVTTLAPGKLVVKQEGKEVFSHDIDRGVLEVTGTSATVLL